MRFIKALVFTLACTSPCWQTAQAGFFDELFGQERSPQAAPLWPPEDTLPPVKSHRQGSSHHHIVNLAQQIPGAWPQGSAWEVFLHDPTLKNGDAVMTPDGLRIFTGSEEWDHAPDDFAKLSDIAGLPQGERKRLASVERQGPEINWRSISETELQTGRSVAQSSAIETVLDSKGRNIRYVGP